MSTTAISIVILAGFLQGTFFLPMTYTKKWEWAHSWFAFTLLGMVVINWIIAYFTINDVFAIIAQIPAELLLIVLTFGLAWGIGAILFGKAMDLLGMALGYPVIMGINAAAGTIIPALIYSPEIFLELKGLLIIVGILVSVAGIIICTRASKMKNSANEKKTSFSSLGLILAVIAGFTSCLPNIGASFSSGITDIAVKTGVSSVLASNLVWSLFFMMGAVANALYCLYLINKNKSFKAFTNEFKTSNWLLIMGMSVMWMGSFYLYGFGSSMLGKIGLIVGWPLFVSLSIIVGNLWGIYRKEWKDAKEKTRQLLNIGMITLVFSVIIIALSNLF